MDGQSIQRVSETVFVFRSVFRLVFLSQQTIIYRCGLQLSRLRRYIRQLHGTLHQLQRSCFRRSEQI